MALPDRTGNPLFHVLFDSANDEWYLVPLNSEGNDAGLAAFTADGALTTVAITQEAAGKGGFQQTTGEYTAIKLALS